MIKPYISIEFWLTRVLQFEVIPVEQPLARLHVTFQSSCYIVYTGFNAFDLQLCFELDLSAGSLWAKKKAQIWGPSKKPDCIRWISQRMFIQFIPKHLSNFRSTMKCYLVLECQTTSGEKKKKGNGKQEGVNFQLSHPPVSFSLLWTSVWGYIWTFLQQTQRLSTIQYYQVSVCEKIMDQAKHLTFVTVSPEVDVAFPQT